MKLQTTANDFQARARRKMGPNLFLFDFVTWFRSKISPRLELHLLRFQATRFEVNDNTKSPHLKQTVIKSNRHGILLLFYGCHLLCSTKLVKVIKKSYYILVLIYNWSFKNLLKNFFFILTIALTFLPCYYKRKLFHYNQLQTILYNNEPSDLSAVKVGGWAFHFRITYGICKKRKYCFKVL